MDGELFAQMYDEGINDDIYKTWRNADQIGYVQLAMKVVTEAIYDLICGDYPDMMSANYFFFGTMTEDPNSDEDSLYPLWAKVLGISPDVLPDVVVQHKQGYVSQDSVEFIRNLCTTVKTI